jgi:hypothetical protein
MARFYQGVYKLQNPEKYAGNKAPIYRSSWEAKFDRFLDMNKNVVKWISEPSQMVIPYVLPDGSTHSYIPDYYVEMKLLDGSIRKFIVEVKPSKQSPFHSPPPKPPKKQTSKSMSNYRAALKTYTINKFKWLAAQEWCKKRGIRFIVYTEIEAKGGFTPLKKKK